MLSASREPVYLSCLALYMVHVGAPPAEKHAVVLGLKAFVLAHPYDVPKWLPDLLLLLVRASFQPAPIKTSVRYSRLPSDRQRQTGCLSCSVYEKRVTKPVHDYCTAISVLSLHLFLVHLFHTGPLL